MAEKLKFKKGSKRTAYFHNIVRNGKTIGYIHRKYGYTNFCYFDIYLQPDELREIANKIDFLNDKNSITKLKDNNFDDLNFDQVELDNLVHNIKSAEATRINNEGAVSQIHHLLKSGLTLKYIKKVIT